MSSPPFIPPLRFDDPLAALAQVRTVYEQAIAHLRDALDRFVAGEDLHDRVRACYPFVRVRTKTVARADLRLSYGFVAGPGTFETTLTRPDLFGAYYLEQFRLLLDSHHVSLEIGASKQPIPVHFAFAEHDHIEGSMLAERRLLMRDLLTYPTSPQWTTASPTERSSLGPASRARSHCLPRPAWTTPCRAA